MATAKSGRATQDPQDVRGRLNSFRLLLLTFAELFLKLVLVKRGAMKRPKVALAQVLQRQDVGVRIGLSRKKLLRAVAKAATGTRVATTTTTSTLTGLSPACSSRL